MSKDTKILLAMYAGFCTIITGGFLWSIHKTDKKYAEYLDSLTEKETKSNETK